METQALKVPWTMTVLPRPSCSTKTSQSKVLADHRCNSYSTTDSVIPFLHSQSLTSYTPNVVVAAQNRKEILHHRNEKIERYNKYIHNLPPLQADDTVAIQSPLNHKWNTTGKILIVLPDH